MSTPAAASPAVPATTAPIRAPQATTASPARKKKAAERRFLVPGETEWELWAGSDAASSHFVSTVASPVESSDSHITALGLPVQEVITVPIWLATTDRSLIPEMVALQCEKRGVLNRARVDSPFDFEVVAQENNESLVRAHILPSTLSSEVCAPTVEQFDLACRFAPLPAQAVLVWRELGALCVAITRKGMLVYAAPLGNDDLQGEGVSRLFRLLSVASGERWISGTPEVILRGTFNATEENAVRSTLGLTVRRENRPAPWPPAKPSKLVPDSVQAALAERRHVRVRNQRLLIAVGVYLVAMLIWGGYVGWLTVQTRLLSSKVSATAPQVELLRSTALRWNLLQPAISPSHFPVEILFRCASVLPKEGIQLTVFEQRGPKVLIMGESRGTDALGTVNAYVKDLKANKDLKDFTWNLPQPIIRDNACKFQIEGTRATAHP